MSMPKVMLILDDRIFQMNFCYFFFLFLFRRREIAERERRERERIRIMHEREECLQRERERLEIERQKLERERMERERLERERVRIEQVGRAALWTVQEHLGGWPSLPSRQILLFTFLASPFSFIKPSQALHNSQCTATGIFILFAWE